MPAASELPQDVQDWLRRALMPGEAVHACLLADILPNGDYGERWAFLSNQRLLVLAPTDDPDEAEVTFDIPLDHVEGARLVRYVRHRSQQSEGRRSATGHFLHGSRHGFE